MVVSLCLSSQVTNGLGASLIGAGPDSQCDAVKGMLSILLQDKGVVQALRLASARDKLDVVRKASLEDCQSNVDILIGKRNG